jgi:beta-glucosidase
MAAQRGPDAGQCRTGGPQFAYGHGLRYGQDGNLALLGEDPGVDLSTLQSARFFERGALAKGWRLRTTHAGKSAHASVAAEAKGPGVLVSAVDHAAQEDAWRYVWQADGPSSIAFVAPEPLDLSRETNGDVMLLLTLRTEPGTPAETSLFVECGEKCGGKVAVGAQLAALPPGQWTDVGILLKCFAAQGANMASLTVPAGIESVAGYQVSISKVGYGTVAEHVIACPTP